MNAPRQSRNRRSAAFRLQRPGKSPSKVGSPAHVGWLPRAFLLPKGRAPVAPKLSSQLANNFDYCSAQFFGVFHLCGHRVSAVKLSILLGCGSAALRLRVFALNI
jgi:hypothetical protein